MATFNQHLKKVINSFDNEQLEKNLIKACDIAETEYATGGTSETLFCNRYRRIRAAKRHAEIRIQVRETRQAEMIFA